MENRRVVLVSRPEGEPEPANFRVEIAEAPEPDAGRVLVRNLYLSIDPYMRGRMSDRASYAKPVSLGGVMVGGTVGRVVKSNAAGIAVGEFMVGYGGWQDYSVFDPKEPSVLRVPSGLPLSTALGVAGMTGATAYFGLNKL